MTVKHILVSPPIGFTSFFLVPFKYSSYTGALKKILQADQEVEATSKALLVYGEKDQFSSVSDYKKYISTIATEGESERLSVVTIDKGDHFYSSQDMRHALGKAINDWVWV